MSDIIERSLKFVFRPSCAVIKFDETSWHRNQMKSLLKAMDIVCHSDDTHWWIEIKDCAGYEEFNRPRLSPRDPDELVIMRDYLKKHQYDGVVTAGRKKLFIVDEVLCKFKATMISMVAASRHYNNELADFVAIHGKSTPLKVVLVLTWNGNDFKRLAVRLQDKLNKSLAPYSAVGYVTDGNIELPGQCWRMERITANACVS